MLQISELYDDFIMHAFFTRYGGFSQDIYKSLNCGYGSGDDKRLVSKNRARAMQSFGLSAEALYTCRQHHSSSVVVIKDKKSSEPCITADAMVTTSPGVALGILTADCGPVLLADCKSKVIGAAHAGWKGALGGILENTIQEMIGNGADINNIVAGIGPIIGPNSYEVGPEFPAPFIAQAAANANFFSLSSRKDHFMFDLPGYIESRLTTAGITKFHSINRDTYTENETFFSYRRSCHQKESDYGRLLSAIAIR